MSQGAEAREITYYGIDKLRRADKVIARIRNEVPIHLSIEQRCVLIKFNPGKNTLKDGLDEEILLFYTEQNAEMYFQTVGKII